MTVEYIRQLQANNPGDLIVYFAGFEDQSAIKIGQTGGNLAEYFEKYFGRANEILVGKAVITRVSKVVEYNLLRYFKPCRTKRITPQGKEITNDFIEGDEIHRLVYGLMHSEYRFDPKADYGPPRWVKRKPCDKVRAISFNVVQDMYNEGWWNDSTHADRFQEFNRRTGLEMAIFKRSFQQLREEKGLPQPKRGRKNKEEYQRLQMAA